ncbi:MAG TPA: Uma2 family endonuclease [Pirellulaceae bacterium]|jgi:Uma2 family endonuclease
MSTATLRTRLGLADHGRELTYDEFLAGRYANGYKYELIDGRLYVSPAANYPHDWVQEHINEALALYKSLRPSVVQRISSRCRVFVPGRHKTTCPEPDFAIYKTCPPGRDVDWQDISPMIVVEIVSPDDPHKDYVRNVELYQRVPSILEYWVFDRCRDPHGPTMTVYHRMAARQKWKTDNYGPEDIYTTALLPGFKLPVCPPK